MYEDVFWIYAVARVVEAPIAARACPDPDSVTLTPFPPELFATLSAFAPENPLIVTPTATDGASKTMLPLALTEHHSRPGPTIRDNAFESVIPRTPVAPNPFPPWT